MKKLLLLIPVLAFSAAINLPALAEDASSPLEKLVSELAEKPEHHSAIAKYYKEKAATARADAAEHRKMANAHIGHSKSPLTQQNWRSHCEKLANSLEATAKEYDELAKVHEEEMKQ